MTKLKIQFNVKYTLSINNLKQLSYREPDTANIQWIKKTSLVAWETCELYVTSGPEDITFPLLGTIKTKGRTRKKTEIRQ